MIPVLFQEFQHSALLSMPAGAAPYMNEAFIKLNKCIKCAFCEVNSRFLRIYLIFPYQNCAQRVCPHLRNTGENLE